MLTGKIRLRSTWTGKLVVQVEYIHTMYDAYGGPESKCLAWRDAGLKDLSVIQGKLDLK